MEKTAMKIAIPACANVFPEFCVVGVEEESRTPPTMARMRAMMLGMWRAWRARMRRGEPGLVLIFLFRSSSARESLKI